VDLQHGLARLQAAEFLYEKQLFPELEYTFKHALTQETAYASLLQERRRALHARLVPALEEVHADRLEEHVERLGHHALRGGVWNKAADYLYRAGAKAFGRSALREAAGWYEQAKMALGHVTQTEEIGARVVDICFELRNALMQIGDYARAKDHLLEAKARAEALGDRRRLGQALSILANYYLNTGDLDAALDSGNQALTTAESVGDFRLDVMVSVHLGWIHCTTGDWRVAGQMLTRHVGALTGHLATDHFGMGLPASVLSRSIAAQAYSELGEFDRGVRLAREAVQLTEARGRALDRVYAYRSLSYVHALQGEPALLVTVAEQGLELAETNGILLFLTWFAGYLAYAHALAGNLDRVPRLVERVKVSVSSTSTWSQALAHIRAGEACLCAERIDEASRLAQTALDTATRHGHRGYRAWAIWLLGEIARTADPDDLPRAAAHYREALRNAIGLAMRPLTAHCHLGLAKLYRRNGGRREAEENLALLNTGSVAWRDLFARPITERRRALKALSVRMPCRPLMRFIYMYVLHLGFLDGLPGFRYCR
jgi:tetratricopeptide (TPR) repeat protein